MAMVIEQCQVMPPPGELTLPLTYFDIVWLNFHRIRRILFYKLSVTKSDFVQTIIPTLKHSLSLALQHYMILAGNVVCPLNSNNYHPELRYVTGDSVSVTFFESDMDFNFLIGNHLRNAKDFSHFVPKLGEPCKNAPGDVQLAPLLAIQVTLFPNHGISIGFTNHHVVGDGASIVGFVRAWALLNKFDGDERILGDNFRPCYDRSLIKDPYGQAKSQWDIMKNYKVEMCDIFSIPSHDKVRGTFIIGRDDIRKLKSLILSRRPGLTHVTSFTVTCAYVWTCLIKSEIATTRDQEIDENGIEFFLYAADWRALLNPPLAPNYFGNCLAGYIASTRHVDLAGKEGFTIGAEIIGEVIQKRRKDEEWILNGDCLEEISAIDKNRMFSVAGSPKHDFYAVDFSWGRTEKLETVSIDSDDGIAMSLNKSRDSAGDLEIGLCMPENRMNAFVAIFSHGLSIL